MVSFEAAPASNALLPVGFLVSLLLLVSTPTAFCQVTDSGIRRGLSQVSSNSPAAEHAPSKQKVGVVALMLRCARLVQSALSSTSGTPPSGAVRSSHCAMHSPVASETVVATARQLTQTCVPSGNLSSNSTNCAFPI